MSSASAPRPTAYGAIDTTPSLTRSNALGSPVRPDARQRTTTSTGLESGVNASGKGTNHSANPALTGTLTAVVGTPPTDAVTSSAVGGKIS